MPSGAAEPALPAQFIDMERKALSPDKPMSEWTKDQLFDGLNVTLLDLWGMVEFAYDSLLKFEIGLKQLRDRTSPRPADGQ